MGPLALWGIGTAAAGLAHGISSAWQGHKNRHEIRRKQEKDIELWHEQNAYNHPKEQMARLKAAGLNPYLVYSHGNAITPSAQNPGGTAAQYNNPVGEGIEAGRQTAALSMAARQTQADVKLKESQARLNAQKTGLAAAQQGNAEWLLKWRNKTEAGKWEMLENTLTKMRKALPGELTTIENQQKLQEAYQEFKNETGKFLPFEAKKLTMKLLENRITISEWDAKLAKIGASRGDGWKVMLAKSIANAFGLNLNTLDNKLSNFLNFK